MSAEASTRAILAAAGANLLIAASKAVAWALTGSSAMLAEAIHSVADTSNQGLLLLGARRAQRSEDETHQFGYGRSRYLAAFIVSIVLFTMGGIFALYEAYHKFSHPQAITAWHWVPVAVLVVSIVAEGFSLRTALHAAHQSRGKTSLWAYIRSSRSPEIPVVLLEDIAALTGLVIALGGVSLTLITGDGRWDAAGSAAIGILLVVVAAFLAQETASLLLGESAHPEVNRQVRAALVGGHVREVVSLRTLHLGPEEVLVAAQIRVAADSSGKDIAEAIDQAEARVRATAELEFRIYLEPVLAAGVGD